MNMAKKSADKKQIETLIAETIQNEKPQTAQELVSLVLQKSEASQSQITDALLEMENRNQISFTKSQSFVPFTLTHFIFSNQAIWFWLSIVLCIVTILALLLPSNVPAAIYFSSGLSAVFILFLPGLSLSKTLFPTHIGLYAGENTEGIERVAVSLGLSLALVPIIAAILNFTQPLGMGIALAPLAASLLLFTVGFSIAGLLREYHERKRPLFNSQKTEKRLIIE
jgi:hypothetical protein